MYARLIHRTAWAPIARSGLDQVHCKPLSAPPLFRHLRDLDVHNLGSRESSAAPGGLPTLQLVPGPVGLPLCGGLIPGELRGYALLPIEGLFLKEGTPQPFDVQSPNR